MKTKTDYFTKFITFCVLSLFLITNMILFTSCDNGNSPNNNTNEEQNDNAPTDYCKICDGVQDKDHQHDYCDDCDGIQDKNHQHEQGGTENEDGTITETTYPDWFQEEHIGGEDSPYKIAYPNWSKYIDDITTTEVEPITMLNDFNNEFKKYIKSFTFSEDFNFDTTINFKSFSNTNSDITINYTENFDYLIGSVNDNISGSINDICAPVFKDIISNLNDIDQQLLYVYYKALKNEAKKYNYINNTTEITPTYTDTKNNEIKIFDDNELIPFNSFYQTVTDEKGNTSEVINPQVATEMTNILQKAANNNKDLLSNYQNIVNLSFVSDMLEMTDNYTSQITNHNSCKDHTNQMTGVIENEIGL